MPDNPSINNPQGDMHVRGSERPYKEGHPRFNIAILLVILAVLLAFALIEAQRLAF